MPHANESRASATLSGRELALKRRKAMALHGKSAFVKTAANRQGTSSQQAPAAVTRPATASGPAEHAKRVTAGVRQPPVSPGRDAARTRREALSVAGKAALKPTASRPSGRMRPTPEAAYLTAPAAAKTPAAATKEDCDCRGEPCDCHDQDSRRAGETSSTSLAAPASAKKPMNPLPKGRALARARREALSQSGKAGLVRAAHMARVAAAMPDQDWQSAISNGASGRQIAMQRRKVQSVAGRAATARSSTKSRPSGRKRARLEIPAPPKVEKGHTLSGQTVTGTMVERSSKLTGNEPGACRTITGTEYIGAELYERECPARPAPAPTKVGVSSTTREHKVTGTEVGRSMRVTGDEIGACKGITGTEYLAAERFEEFCSTRPAPSPAKVGSTDTAKGKPVTGTVVDRSSHVTGNEHGSGRAVTGTGYALPATPAPVPEKVALTHTAGGRTVTGTSVGHSSRVTGDEPGSCRSITGTEYLSAEQFQTECNTTPPTTPRKVSVMLSRGQQPVSGTEVGRSANVTGNEAGSCREISGNQYFTAADFSDLCSVNGPRKVGTMHTLAGGTVTGTEVHRNPKMSGDDKGGCMPVTGTDYVGTQQLQAVCADSTPVSAVDKVATDKTWRGQPITGSPIGRAPKVTGDESGGCSPISGTPYIGRSQYGEFCETPDMAAQEAVIPSSTLISATTVTGDRPGAGGSVMTGDERGACEPVSGTPYVGADNLVSQCMTSGRFVSRAQKWDEPARPAPPADFSIHSPARTAWDRRAADEITGSAYSSERITGPVNKAPGLITGTPEFRHRDSVSLQASEQESIAAARRLTGEGSQSGRKITGDSWDASTRVTGTEGTSSLARNMSQRGQPRGEGANARRFREVEQPPAPESRITGSAGNFGKGPLVTLSGGARG
jgi:hypothetical protein